MHHYFLKKRKPRTLLQLQGLRRWELWLQAGCKDLGGFRLQSMTQLQVVKRRYRIKSTEIAPQLQAEAKRAWWFQAEIEGGSLALQTGMEEALVSA